MYHARWHDDGHDIPDDFVGVDEEFFPSMLDLCIDINDDDDFCISREDNVVTWQ